MRRNIVIAGTIAAGAAIAAAVARRPLKAHLAEGTLPGRSGSWLNSYLNRPSCRLMAAALDLRPEDDLLDVACGWGEFLAVHAPQARHVAGLDVSGEKAALARQRLADRIAAGTAEVIQGDVSDEAAVRQLVEDAGFGEVSVSYGPVGGDSRLGSLASRLMIGSDELRLVAAVKPGGAGH